MHVHPVKGEFENKKMKLFDRVKKATNRGFMEAVAASYALVAFSDSLVRPEETDKLYEYVRLDENLRVFEIHEVDATVERYIGLLEFDFNLGKEKAFKALEIIEKRSESAKLIVLLCCAIGGADADFSNNQRLMVRQICAKLGFDPREFKLDLRAPEPADFPVPPIRPETRRPSEKAAIPEWMQEAEKSAGPLRPAPAGKSAKPKTGTDKADDIPEWMRNPPAARAKPKSATPGPSDAKPADGIPDWMKKRP